MLRYRFRPHNRLKTPKEFQSVFDQNSIRVGSPSLLILAKDNQLEHARLGLVIRKKNIRLAHDRNNVKRVVRESFRHLQNQLVGLDCVVLSRPQANELSAKELRTLTDQMFCSLAKKYNANTNENP